MAISKFNVWKVGYAEVDFSTPILTEAINKARQLSSENSYYAYVVDDQTILEGPNNVAIALHGELFYSEREGKPVQQILSEASDDAKHIDTVSDLWAFALDDIAKLNGVLVDDVISTLAEMIAMQAGYKSNYQTDGK